MTYLQALQQLQYWLTSSQASHANHLNFNAHPLSAAELQAIREYTKNRLPETYYLFLQQCGTGDFFYSWYTSVIDQALSQTPKIEIYNLTQLQEQNFYYQQLLSKELDNLPPDEHPDIGEIFIIGAHHSMGDWFGFNLSRAEPNFDIFIHDAETLSQRGIGQVIIAHTFQTRVEITSPDPIRLIHTPQRP